MKARRYFKDLAERQTEMKKREGTLGSVSRRLEDILRKRKITLEEYFKLLIEQDNKCLVCTRTFSRELFPHVDHDHKSGKIRALLCRHCNVAAGMIRDEPDTAHRLALYLEIMLTKGK